MLVEIFKYVFMLKTHLASMIAFMSSLETCPYIDSCFHEKKIHKAVFTAIPTTRGWAGAVRKKRLLDRLGKSCIVKDFRELKGKGD